MPAIAAPGEAHEDHRHHRHAFCLGRHPRDAVRPPQRPLLRQERPRPRYHQDRPGRRGACLPRLIEQARQRRRCQSHRQDRQADAARREPARPRAAFSAHVGEDAHEQPTPGARRSRRRALGPGRKDRQHAGPPADGKLSHERAGVRQLVGPPLGSRPIARRRFRSRRAAGPPTRSTRRRSGRPTSASARPCARRSATTTA